MYICEFIASVKCSCGHFETAILFFKTFPLGAIGQRVRLLIARLWVQFPQWKNIIIAFYVFFLEIKIKGVHM
jgi:uncharacterized membrane protein